MIKKLSLIVAVILFSLSFFAQSFAAEGTHLITHPGYVNSPKSPVKKGEEFGMTIGLAWQIGDEPIQPADFETASVFVYNEKPGDMCRLDNPQTDSNGIVTVICKSETPGDFLVGFRIREFSTNYGVPIQIYDPNATPKPSPTTTVTPKPKASPKPSPSVSPSPTASASASPSSSPIIIENTRSYAGELPKKNSPHPALVFGVVAITSLASGLGYYWWKRQPKTQTPEVIETEDSSESEQPFPEE